MWSKAIAPLVADRSTYLLLDVALRICSNISAKTRLGKRTDAVDRLMSTELSYYACAESYEAPVINPGPGLVGSA